MPGTRFGSDWAGLGSGRSKVTVHAVNSSTPFTLRSIASLRARVELTAETRAFL
jgi:hypothetical protein